jgi:hypothetical protein
MHLMHGSHLKAYSTLGKSMMSAFEITLGKFDATQFIKTSPVMGSLVFTAYNVVIIYCVLNIFVSILTNTYAKVRGQARYDDCGAMKKQFDLVDHLLERFKSQRMNKIGEKTKKVSLDEYKSYYGAYEHVINRLNFTVSRVNRISFLNIFYLECK